MNYLLVMPKKLSTGANTTSIIFPLGIAYVSAALKQAGFRVFTANLDFPEGDTYSILREVMLANSIDVVCTGGLSLDCHKIKEVVDTARKINPKIITVVGGGIISSDPETAMRVLDADIGVIGEGERTICELAHALDNGEKYGNIQGLIYRDSHALIKTTPRKEIADLDSIPFPDFDGFNYGQWVSFFGGAGALLSDRSCPFRCTFCFHPTGEKYRQRSLDNIFKEIDHQVQNYHLTSIGLTSELFATTKQRVLEFCDRVKKYNISWSCCLRVPDVDSDLLRKMRESGCNLVCYGLESADNSILKSMRKGIKVDQIKRALDLSYEAGISTEASNFIFGDINETAETVANTMKFWWGYNRKTHINLSLIQTYPGTYLYEYACQKGIITDKEQFLRDGCPIINVSKLSSDEFHELTSMVAELRMHPHLPAESLRIVEMQEDGNCAIEYICRKCGTRNFTQTWFWYTGTCHCSACGIKNEVDAFLGASYQEDAFLANLPAASTVALWGAGGIYYKLIHQYSGLAVERFSLVDANAELHGLNICKKIVHPPDVIARDGIQTVIIMALSRKNEIHATLRGSYPSVKNVLVPSFEITGNGIVPILQPFQPNECKENTR
ncbi:Radical SAM domain protein [Syntrophobacter sp. SbD1]|nr:Radical SAM domain protein [Syntrophobacter sp. SbD1]